MKILIGDKTLSISDTVKKLDVVLDCGLRNGHITCFLESSGENVRHVYAEINPT